MTTAATNAGARATPCTRVSTRRARAPSAAPWAGRVGDLTARAMSQRAVRNRGYAAFSVITEPVRAIVGTRTAPAATSSAARRSTTRRASRNAGTAASDMTSALTTSAARYASNPFPRTTQAGATISG